MIVITEKMEKFVACDSHFHGSFGAEVSFHHFLDTFGGRDVHRQRLGGSCHFGFRI